MKTTYKIITITIICGFLSYLTSCKNSNSENKNIEQKITADKDSSHMDVPPEYIDLLFADQTIAEINKVATANPLDNNSVWKNFILASKFSAGNKKDEAVKIFQEIANTKNNDSRTMLWAWNGLRELGIKPKSTEVYGFILEVPIKGSIEYLAMYSDQTARYINYTGKIAVWETHQPVMDNLIQAVFINAKDLLSKQSLQIGRSKVKTNKVRFNFLTSTGIYQTEKTFKEISAQQSDIGNIFNASGQVLSEIVHQSIAKQSTQKVAGNNGLVQ
jgi:hypothetical protein